MGGLTIPLLFRKKTMATYHKFIDWHSGETVLINENKIISIRGFRRTFPVNKQKRDGCTIATLNSETIDVVGSIGAILGGERCSS